MSHIVLQDVLTLAVLAALSFPLGIYMYKVMTGRRVFLSRIMQPLENGIYRIMGVQANEEMSAKSYTVSLLLFSLIGLVFVWLLQMLQGVLPGNPEGMPATSWHLAFNTAASFVSNTNWQAYSGETTLSYLTQALGLTVQNFVSAAAGIAVLFALIRGFISAKSKTLGSFWVDLIALHAVCADSAVAHRGGSARFAGRGANALGLWQATTTLESGAAQTLPLGPAASQIAIKQLGTNGGGFFGANSAYPLENPNAISNLIEMLSILLIPAALCVTFGQAVEKRKAGAHGLYRDDDSLRRLRSPASPLSEQYGGTVLRGRRGLRQHGGQRGHPWRRRVLVLGQRRPRRPPTARSMPCMTALRRLAGLC